jgi:hypothetical protein
VGESQELDEFSNSHLTPNPNIIEFVNWKIQLIPRNMFGIILIGKENRFAQFLFFV